MKLKQWFAFLTSASYRNLLFDNYYKESQVNVLTERVRELESYQERAFSEQHFKNKVYQQLRKHEFAINNPFIFKCGIYVTTNFLTKNYLITKREVGFFGTFKNIYYLHESFLENNKPYYFEDELINEDAKKDNQPI